MKISIKREQNDARIGYAERKTFRTQFKTLKLFSMAALALMMAACSSEDNDITTATQKSEGVKFTATISTGNSGVTRALSENGNTIKATWAVNEEVVLFYTVGGTAYNTTATVSAVNGGKATITATLDATPTEETAVTLIYPASAADYDNGNVSPNLLLTQLGCTLDDVSTYYDVRTGSGTLTRNGNTATLKTAVTMENQYAIWKITTPASANHLCIMADNTPIAHASLMFGSGTFYVAVPAVSSKTITVVATDDSNYYYYSKDVVSLAASTYYKSDLSTSMTTLDEDNTKSVYKISATTSTTIPDGKTVVFSGVNINGGNITCSGNATIILMGINTVAMNGAGACIQAGGSGSTLTITGTGTLYAIGDENYISAGIGTSSNNTCGNIVIRGGMIMAAGYGGAGIGACDKATCGDITITGGTIDATGNLGAAGIGTGLAMYGNSDCGNILISGGTVMATGGNYGNVVECGGAGIGAGHAQGGNTTCGTITITSGVTRVIATKGTTAANSIGAGTSSNDKSSSSGTVTIENGANVFQN